MENKENKQEYVDLPYTSKITSDLVVLGTEDMSKIDDILNDKSRKYKIVGTHSEVFHCDEVLATTMLLWTKLYEDSIIIRTRNEDVLKHLDIICDVGSIFDKDTGRFDHH